MENFFGFKGAGKRKTNKKGKKEALKVRGFFIFIFFYSNNYLKAIANG